jgi:hypothetical protein
MDSIDSILKQLEYIIRGKRIDEESLALQGKGLLEWTIGEFSKKSSGKRL